MDAQDFRSLQEAYMEVYQPLDEDWKPVNVSRVKSRMGNLEGRLSSVSNDRFSHNTPEYVRYQRTADVVSQSTRNPNKPFQKPTFEPGGLIVKPGGGVTRSLERNPQWEPFSSRLPKTNEPSTSKSSPPTQPKPKVANQFTNRLTTGRSGNGTFSDKSGDYRADLRRRGSSSRGRGGGSSSLSNVGSPSGTTGRYQVGGSPSFGISGIRLADEYDLYDIILSHLLDEGYAETPEAAEAIMVNMSEEWREIIVEGNLFEREMDEPGERGDSPDVKAHNKTVKYRPRPRRPRIEDNPRYGTPRDEGGNWKY